MLIEWYLGHNELDDPSFTQPLMYKRIREKKCMVEMFADVLDEEDVYPAKESIKYSESYKNQLEKELDAVDSDQIPPIAEHLRGQWSGFVQTPPVITKWDTGVSMELLRFCMCFYLQLQYRYE